MFHRITILFGLILLWMGSDVCAQTSTGVLAVTATVGTSSGCILNTISTLLFPDYFPFNTGPDEASSAITVSCNAGVPYDVGLDPGTGPSKTVLHRSMSRTGFQGKGLLSYGLFWTSDHQNQCGNTIGQDTRHLLGTGAPQITRVYGEIPARQSVAAGAYSDRITVSVTF